MIRLHFIFLVYLPISFQRSLAAPVVAESESDQLCSINLPNYALTWTYDELSNDVVFKLTTSSNLTNFWTSVSFGDAQPKDTIGVFVRAGQIGLVDGHVTADGVEFDDVTNVQSLAFDLHNGRLTAQFARPLSTGDAQDEDLNECTIIFVPEEPREIDAGRSLEVARESSRSLHVCDIVTTCIAPHNSEIAKREDALPICAVEAYEAANGVSWKLRDDRVVFSIEQKAKKGRWWTSIGFGDNMQDLEMIVIFAEDGKLKRIGTYHAAGYAPPQASNNELAALQKEAASVKNGRTSIEVSVKADFAKAKAKADGCIRLQVAILAGQYTPQFAIRKHIETPMAVDVCGIERCGVEGAVPAKPVENAITQPTIEGNPEGEPSTTSSQPAAPKEDVTSSTPAPSPQLPSEPINAVNVDGPSAATVSVPAGNPVSASGDAEGSRPTTMSTAASAVEGQLIATTSARTPQKIEEAEGSGTLEEGSGAVQTPDETENHKPLLTLPIISPGESTDKPENASKENVLEAESATSLALAPPLTASASAANSTSTDAVATNSSTSETPTVGACGPGHEDLRVCESYFEEYLAKVDEWSRRHNMTVAAHMWKACTLLSEVKHVTTMCCSIFRNTCASQLGFQR